MKSVESMSPRQLLELASLDALGLLDPVEAGLYTRSFHDAPASVQDEIVRLQSEIASDYLLLPGEEPAPQLRERVLRAVADAIERDDSFAPLARIGLPRHDTGQAGGGPGRTSVAGQFWRAASFVLAGVSLIMAYFLAIGRQASDELYAAAIWGDTAALEVLLTPPSKQFLLDGSTKIDLRPVDDTAEYDASLFVDTESGRALLLVANLPPAEGRAYVMQAVVDGADEPIGITRFHSEAGFGGVKLDTLPANLLAAAVTWQIATLDGVVLLSSA